MRQGGRGLLHTEPSVPVLLLIAKEEPRKARRLHASGTPSTAQLSIAYAGSDSGYREVSAEGRLDAQSDRLGDRCLDARPCMRQGGRGLLHTEPSAPVLSLDRKRKNQREARRIKAIWLFVDASALRRIRVIRQRL